MSDRIRINSLAAFQARHISVFSQSRSLSLLMIVWWFAAVYWKTVQPRCYCCYYKSEQALFTEWYVVAFVWHNLAFKL